jgi:hypothetical protein
MLHAGTRVVNLPMLLNGKKPSDPWEDEDEKVGRWM